jgi:hypothetical protein
MGTDAGAAAPAHTREQEAAVPADREKGKPEPKVNAEYLEALEKLERAQERMLSSAIAFCDGLISAGQLRAVRELLREQERKIDALGGIQASPFMDEVPDAPQAEESPNPAVQTATPMIDQGVATDLVEAAEEPSLQDIEDPELRQRLEVLDDKIARLEQDFQQGRINASQYRAIYRHYMEQREVALRLRQKYPDSDRWQVVLEEGKTRFLLQLNEAACYSVGLYRKDSRDRIYVHGDMPASAEEAMGLLGTFGSNEGSTSDGRIFATKTETGETLLLIPGSFTVSLAVFSQDPPAWQVRALREVHRNFEAANRPALQRGDTKKLIFPDLSRFVKN